ncbi:hypothetical protein L6164_024933 [Bauhinia variegata]|nr:hypothetical protein L6164_024933 [Bauhinia variegata]
MATRKRDDPKVVLYVKAKNKIANQMEKLVCDIRCISQLHSRHIVSDLSSPTLVSLGDAELAGVIGDVISVTVSVSIALFNGIAMSLASRKLSWRQLVKSSRTGKRVKKELQGIEEFQQGGLEGLSNLNKARDEEVRAALKRMQDLESCICGIETVSERVFRALINSRVALLNTLTLTQ